MVSVPKPGKLFNKALQSYITNKTVSIIKGKRVLDIIPNLNWSKGDFAKMVSEKIAKKTKTHPEVIIIGDDTTDEDIFLTFNKGVTINVGENRQSSAKYNLSNTRETLKFLKWIAANF